MGFLFKRKTTQNFNTQTDALISSPALSPENIKASESTFLPYDPSNIFIYEKSQDGNLELFRDLFPDKNIFRFYFKNVQKDILIKKEFSHLDNQSVGIFHYAFSNTGVAVVIDTYFNDNPHTVLDFFLFDNSGNELFHVYYQKNGPRNFKFSESGRYFILLDYTHFYVYDMNQKQLNEFSPEDIYNSDFNDFIIFEENHLLAYCYTQHPDKPFYHFTFGGHLVEENAFYSQIEKMNELDAESQRYYAMLEEIDAIEKPLSNETYEKYITELKTYASNPEYASSAWLYRKMGELELDANNKADALMYFEKALSLDSQVGVKRIVAKLKKELNND